MRASATLCACLLLAACGTPGTRPGSGQLIREIDQGRMREQLRRSGSSSEINYRNSCSFRNETGYNGSTRVEIEDNHVRYLATAINVPSAGGSCSFGGSGFRQTRFGPSLELSHADGCTVRIWTQGRQMTISYTHCESRCTPARVFSKVWPVLIDMPSGQCD